jgi:hypothetical protein
MNVHQHARMTVHGRALLVLRIPPRWPACGRCGGSGRRLGAHRLTHGWRDTAPAASGCCTIGARRRPDRSACRRLPPSRACGASPARPSLDDCPARRSAPCCAASGRAASPSSLPAAGAALRARAPSRTHPQRHQDARPHRAPGPATALPATGATAWRGSAGSIGTSPSMTPRVSPIPRSCPANERRAPVPSSAERWLSSRHTASTSSG